VNIVQVLQGVGIVLAALGLSAGPWIVALLAGRLIPVSTVKRERDDSQKRIDSAEKAMATWQGVAERQTKRADDAILALSNLANESGTTTVHLLKSLGELTATPLPEGQGAIGG